VVYTYLCNRVSQSSDEDSDESSDSEDTSESSGEGFLNAHV
jgi:hypothetical protein